MFLNKLWFILVALAASVAMTIALVAPQSASRQLGQVEARGLDRAQYAAEQMLKGDARRWIDTVAKIGRDAKVTEALENASRDAGEARLLNETVRARLGSLVPDPAGVGMTVLGAVDGNGKVIARIGKDENQYGESIGGIEVVADALRGYLTDSMSVTDGKVTRLAAAPVLSKTRDRVVGAIWVGVDASERLADLWKKNLGVEVAFLVAGQVATATMSQGALGTLGAEVDARRAEIAKDGRTHAFSLPLGNDTLLAVAAPFPGEAGALGGHYVLLEKLSAAASPVALLAATTKQDLAWETFPWIGLAATVVAMLGIGLLLLRREVEGPLTRLRREIQRLARGEIHKLDDGRHSGRFGGIARDVNASLERFAAGGGLPSETSRKDLNKILGGDGDRDRVASLPPLPPLGGPAGGWGGAGGGGGGGFGAGPPGGFAPSRTPGGGGGMAGAISPFSGPNPGSSGNLSTLGLGSVPAARLASPPLPPTAPGARPPFGGGPPGAPSMPPGPAPFSAGTPAPASEPHPMATTVPVTPGARAMQAMDDSPTHDMQKESKTTAVDEWESHVRAVFAEYVETRARGGESIAGLTLDKFREKLDANRQQIIQKHKCRSARFTVYAKDGKAALKAAPVV